jgi:superfamily I DNA/RNA helicase
VAGDSFDDLEGKPELGRRELTVARRGGTVRRIDGSRPRDVETALTRALEEACREGHRPGDMAVLTAYLDEADRCHRVLWAAGIASVDLQDYDGMTSSAVKVGTFKRAKGLEFSHVYLPYLRPTPPALRVGESEEAFRERSERGRRELFVGMTRARDLLWLGYVTG